MSYLVKIQQPSIPYPSYVWRDRFTTDRATATRYDSVRAATQAAATVVRSLHLDASVSIAGDRD